MKEYVVEFTETVTYSVVINAESIDDAKDKLMGGDYDDVAEVWREFNEVTSITPDYEDDEDEE